MTSAEFGIEMDRLKECYGERLYPKPREELIWKWAKKINSALFTAIVEKLIAENERAPLLGKFQDAYSQLKSRFKNNERKCIYCENSGLILDPESKMPFIAYACRCEHGRAVPVYVARWTGSLVRVVPTEAELNWRDVKKVFTHVMKSMPKED